ncbi:uncharacterized protein LOC115627290 [Scaptodrosophila lebanonensis]|uniref:Uncharacterized protein LOC115627290 n=1 Tax=Drosophila lebanonensis TaxID=7225 RepID=A0A6J2TV54_DROLE|nr:uncharacterized protein LOC115627290 [Scaptodrosophila lebanonensis]
MSTSNINHIYLTSNTEYGRLLVQLCEKSAKCGKNVLIITQSRTSLSDMLEKHRSSGHFLILLLSDIESAPRHIVELYECTSMPDLIIFDLNSIIVNLLRWPVMQQRNTETLVRNIAKCAAAFCSYRQMVQQFKEQQQQKRKQEQLQDMGSKAKETMIGKDKQDDKKPTKKEEQEAIRSHPLNTIIIMPTDTYPLSPAQFKLLIGLYFYDNVCHTDFARMVACIRDSQCQD